MHMVSKKDLNSAELRISKNPMTVMTANGEVQTREEATVETSLSKLCFLKKHPQFLHSGSSARIMGFLTTGPAVKNHFSPKNDKRNDCNISNYVPFVVPSLSTMFLYNTHTYFFNIFISGFRI